MRDRFAYPDAMPAWLSEEDLDVYAGEFERTGFTGGLNRYRNVDRDWEDLAAFRGRPIEVPALFIGGDRDGPTIWGMPLDRALPADAAAAAPLDHPAGLRALDAAGAPGGGQRGAARVPRGAVTLDGSPPTMTDAAGPRRGRRRTSSSRPTPPAPGPRLRRAADRPGAAGRPAHRAPTASRRTRCTCRSPSPARAASRSATRSSGPATAPASPPAASSPARRGASSPCSRPTSTTTSRASSTRRRRRRASPVPTGCRPGATTTRTSSRATCPSLDGDPVPHARRAWFRPDRAGARRPAAAPPGAGLPQRPRADASRPRAARPPRRRRPADVGVARPQRVVPPPGRRQPVAAVGARPGRHRAVAAACRSARSAPPTGRWSRPSPRRSCCASADVVLEPAGRADRKVARSTRTRLL